MCKTQLRYTVINTFTATLAAPSLRKRPIKVPNLKPLRLVLSPSHEHMNGFLLKCTVLEVDLLQDHQIHCLEVCMCALFSPEIVQAVAVKGLTAAEDDDS